MIDGSDNNDVSVTISTMPVVPEAVAEFQVQTNPYNVEFGRNSGAPDQRHHQVRHATRFHGEAWEYYRTSEPLLAQEHREDQRTDRSPGFTATRPAPARAGRSSRTRRSSSGSTSTTSTARRHSSARPCASDAGRLRGAESVPLRRRTVGGEPAGRAGAARVPAGHLRAGPDVPLASEHARQRRADRDRADQRDARSPTRTTRARRASTIGSRQRQPDRPLPPQQAEGRRTHQQHRFRPTFAAART